MPTIDPRKDSLPPVASEDPTKIKSQEADKIEPLQEVLNRLTSLAMDGRETRAAVKGIQLSIDGLEKSHADNASSLNSLRNSVADLGQRVSRVEGKAETATQLVGTLQTRVSDTQHQFETTLAAVSSNTNAIATKTTGVAVETTNQTVILNDQTAKIESLLSLFNTAKKYTPQMLIAASIIGAVIGKFLDALLTAIHSAH